MHSLNHDQLPEVEYCELRLTREETRLEHSEYQAKRNEVTPCLDEPERDLVHQFRVRTGATI